MEDPTWCPLQLLDSASIPELLANLRLLKRPRCGADGVEPLIAAALAVTTARRLRCFSAACMLWAHPSTDRYVVIAGAGDPGRLLGLSIGRCLSLTDLQACVALEAPLNPQLASNSIGSKPRLQSSSYLGSQGNTSLPALAPAAAVPLHDSSNTQCGMLLLFGNTPNDVTIAQNITSSNNSSSSHTLELADSEKACSEVGRAFEQLLLSSGACNLMDAAAAALHAVCSTDALSEMVGTVVRAVNGLVERRHHIEMQAAAALVPAAAAAAAAATASSRQTAAGTASHQETEGALPYALLLPYAAAASSHDDMSPAASASMSSLGRRASLQHAGASSLGLDAAMHYEAASGTAVRMSVAHGGVIDGSVAVCTPDSLVYTWPLTAFRLKDTLLAEAITSANGGGRSSSSSSIRPRNVKSAVPAFSVQVSGLAVADCKARLRTPGRLSKDLLLLQDAAHLQKHTKLMRADPSLDSRPEASQLGRLSPNTTHPGNATTVLRRAGSAPEASSKHAASTPSAFGATFGSLPAAGGSSSISGTSPAARGGHTFYVPGSVVVLACPLRPAARLVTGTIARPAVLQAAGGSNTDLGAVAHILSMQEGTSALLGTMDRPPAPCATTPYLGIYLYCSQPLPEKLLAAAQASAAALLPLLAPVLAMRLANAQWAALVRAIHTSMHGPAQGAARKVHVPLAPAPDWRTPLITKDAAAPSPLCTAPSVDAHKEHKALHTKDDDDWSQIRRNADSNQTQHSLFSPAGEIIWPGIMQKLATETAQQGCSAAVPQGRHFRTRSVPEAWLHALNVRRSGGPDGHDGDCKAPGHPADDACMFMSGDKRTWLMQSAPQSMEHVSGMPGGVFFDAQVKGARPQGLRPGPEEARAEGPTIRGGAVERTDHDSSCPSQLEERWLGPAWLSSQDAQRSTLQGCTAGQGQHPVQGAASLQGPERGEWFSCKVAEGDSEATSMQVHVEALMLSFADALHHGVQLSPLSQQLPAATSTFTFASHAGSGTAHATLGTEMHAHAMGSLAAYAYPFAAAAAAAAGEPIVQPGQACGTPSTVSGTEGSGRQHSGAAASDLSNLQLHHIIGRGFAGIVLQGTYFGLDCAVKVTDYPQRAHYTPSMGVQASPTAAVHHHGTGSPGQQPEAQHGCSSRGVPLSSLRKDSDGSRGSQAASASLYERGVSAAAAAAASGTLAGALEEGVDAAPQARMARLDAAGPAGLHAPGAAGMHAAVQAGVQQPENKQARQHGQQQELRRQQGQAQQQENNEQHEQQQFILRMLSRAAMELALCGRLNNPHIVQTYAHYTCVRLQYSGRSPQGGRVFRFVSADVPAGSSPQGTSTLSNTCMVMVMELCDLGSLHGILNNRPQLMGACTADGCFVPHMPSLLMCLIEVALALKHLHAQNVAHGDVKSGNIVVRSSAHDPRGFSCKLADFGFAKLLTPGLGPGGRPGVLPEESVGTLNYMAPEMFAQDVAMDWSIDIYALGMTMYEMLTRQVPYLSMADDYIVASVLQGHRPLLPDCTPMPYRLLAERCWSADPLARPCAAEVAAELHAMLASMPVVTASMSNRVHVPVPVAGGPTNNMPVATLAGMSALEASVAAPS